MSEKLLNNIIAERAKISNRVREMLDAGVKPEQQEAYDKAMADFNNLTKQIEDIRTLEKADDIVENIVMPTVDNKKSFENFVRYGEVYNAVSTATGSAGYLVPEELRKTIVEIMYETGAMIGLAEVFNTNTLTDIPVDATAPTAYWIAEEGTFTASSPTVTRVQIGANKVGTMIQVSEELLADSAFDVEAYISRLAGTALGRTAENEFINGTVSGRPSGFLESATRALTSSVTNSFNYDDIVGLYTAVKTPYANKGSWLMGRPALGALMKLKDTAGNFVFQPAYNAGASDLLLGKPVKTSEYMPALTTTAKGIAFGDFSNYKIGLRGGMTMQRLNELYAATGQVGFKVHFRVDGKLALAESVKFIACL